MTLAHRWPMLGNHDVNVVMLALQGEGLETEWWDARQSDDELSTLVRDKQLLGVLVNVRAAGFLGRLFKGRHWLALRRLSASPAEWLESDSKLPEPLLHMANGIADSRLPAEASVAARLERALREQDGHLIVVRCARDGAAGEASAAVGAS